MPDFYKLEEISKHFGDSHRRFLEALANYQRDAGMDQRRIVREFLLDFLDGDPKRSEINKSLLTKRFRFSNASTQAARNTLVKSISTGARIPLGTANFLYRCEVIHT